MAKLIEIEGIGPANAASLASSGIRTTAALLKRGSGPAGRREIAAATGIDEQRILEWVNRADLMRVRGVGGEYSDLLKGAGVDTIRELAARRPDSLHARMLEVNAQRKLVRRPPSLSIIEAWVAEAAALPAAVSY